MKKTNFRVLTFSNGGFVPQEKVFFGLIWKDMEQAFSTLENAQTFVRKEILLRARPSVVAVSYID